MASAFQGFEINQNLLENLDDRDAINNLGGEPIADDIALFINNLRNFSFLTVKAGAPPIGNIDGSFIVFNAITQKFVYTNKTKITVDDVTYYVGDSNDTNSFRLYTDETLSPASRVLNPPVGDYKRSDAVTPEDIRRLVPTRDKIIENISLSKIGIDTSVSTGFLDTDFYNSMVRIYYNLISNNYPIDLKGYFDYIEKQLDGFTFAKEKSINSKTSFRSVEPLSLAGSFIIKDPGGVNGMNDQPVSTTAGPGIFILNTDDNTSKRIFSGNENAWTDQGTYLGVDSNEIVIGNLVFESPPKILRKNNLPDIVVPIETGIDLLTSSFTHYISVFVNNEEYFVLLK